MSSEAQIRASIKYNAKMIKQIKLALNKATDADVIEWLEQQENMQGYIKKLIRDDMRKRQS